MNFGFTFLDLDEASKAYSAAGTTHTCKHKALYKCVYACTHKTSVRYKFSHHCLVVLKESEHYESMKVGLSDLRKEIESLKNITVAIEYFMGGD